MIWMCPVKFFILFPLHGIVFILAILWQYNQMTIQNLLNTSILHKYVTGAFGTLSFPPSPTFEKKKQAEKVTL